MSKMYKIVCRVLHYIGDLLLLVSAVTGCLSISAFASFASLVAITKGITSSAIGLKICVTTAGIKRY